MKILSLSGSVLFEYECQTTKELVEQAVKSNTNLRGADLRGTNLRGADLRGADLWGADLQGADLQGADLRGAYLQGAYLRGADLQGADLQGAKNADLVIAQTRILPEGDLIGYKRCIGGVIIKLLIPKEAKRSHAFGRKCRAEYAQVLEIFGATEVKSDYDSSFVYRVGETVKPVKPFDEDWTIECASGIHFYITRIEAENH